MLKALYTSTPGRPVHYGNNLIYLGSIHQCSIVREDYSLIFPPQSIARYSFIHMSELGRRGQNNNEKQQQRGFEPKLTRLTNIYFRIILYLLSFVSDECGDNRNTTMISMYDGTDLAIVHA